MFFLAKPGLNEESRRPSKKKKKKKRLVKKDVIINEINGDTGEKIDTHHQRVFSNQDSSFALRDLSYASLNRSPGDSEENPSPVGNQLPPHIPTSVVPITVTATATTTSTTINTTANTTTNVPAIPMFQLQVEEPSKMPDMDEGFGDDVFDVKLILKFYQFDIFVIK